MQQENYNHILKDIQVGDKNYKYYSIPDLKDQRVEQLPFSIRVLLECALRKCDNFAFKASDVEKILDWKKTSSQSIEIPFQPSRVILQDFTGVPAVVDLAAMRDCMKDLKADPAKINPLCPVDLVIDHSVQVDVARTPDAWKQNEKIEFARNRERFEFLKWGQSAFENFKIVPPGSGIVHQVNMEYLARTVFDTNGILYPDSLVGTDSHTTMINGLGIVGWGVGGIEAEAVMLGQPIAMVLPEVVGVKMTGTLPKTSTATDLVLTLTQMLRKRGVVGKFVEFFGPGVASLTVPDRATISNMAPEYGATCGFFAVDDKTIDYLILSGRTKHNCDKIKAYLQANQMYRDYNNSAQDPSFTGDLLELDLATVHGCISGPKRPHDKVTIVEQPGDFKSCLSAKVGFKGFGLKEDTLAKTSPFTFQGKEYTLSHGSLVIAAITSCTNTSNPSVLMAAGLLAKNACEKGLSVNPYIKTSLSPGSEVVTKYLEKAGFNVFLDQLGFTLAGYGCMTCIGNSGDLHQEVSDAITSQDLVVSAVLSGNRNFEGRVHPLTRANYLASPPLVVAYALAGRCDIDFEKEALGQDSEGKDVFLRDIWPSREETEKIAASILTPEMFSSIYANITTGSEDWQNLQVEKSLNYNWKEESTYIHQPPFFTGLTMDLKPINDVVSAYCLLNVGDSVTTDHISPAGKIAANSPAANFLKSKGIEPKDFNTYGARRGNDLIMARGTFANIRIKNKMLNGVEGPLTIHVPTNEKVAIFDGAERYIKEGVPSIILAGREYGSGSSRDWAAKGPFLQGTKAVIAQSYERIHRSNLVGMGVLPLEFKNDESADSLGLTGFERYTIKLNNGNLKVNQDLEVSVDNGVTFTVKVRLDTDPEVEYFKNGGILQYVLRNLARS